MFSLLPLLGAQQAYSFFWTWSSCLCIQPRNEPAALSYTERAVFSRSTKVLLFFFGVCLCEQWRPDGFFPQYAVDVLVLNSKKKKKKEKALLSGAIFELLKNM